MTIYYSNKIRRLGHSNLTYQIQGLNTQPYRFGLSDPTVLTGNLGNTGAYVGNSFILNADGSNIPQDYNSFIPLPGFNFFDPNNLLNTGNNYWWDLSPSDNSITGGSGTWDSSNTFWTNTSGQSNSTLPSTAIAYFGNILSNATVTISGTQSVGGFVFLPTASGSYLITGGTITLPNLNSQVSVSNNATITSTITGPGGLLIAGSSVLNLLGVNSYSGGTSISRATVTIGNASSLGSGDLLIDSLTVFDLSGNSVSIGALKDLTSSYTGEVVTNSVASAVTLTMGLSNSSGVFFGLINDYNVINITKTGSGTQTLSALSNYTGTTTINNGTLQATGSSSLVVIGTTVAQPIDLALDSSNNIYVSNYASNTVTKITPRGAVSTFGTTGTQPRGICVDSSGNIYIANWGSNNITKITPAGVSTIFATVGSNPIRIIMDLSGNFYVSNYGSNNISKITPGGTVTVFAAAGTNPREMVFDSSGNLYVTCQGSNNVRKITPGGTVTVFATVGATPTGITIDSSGNLYTSNLGSNNVSKITQGGVATTFATTGSKPYQIVIDSSDNLYTANNGSNNVTKITPAGVASTYAVTGTNPTSLVIDSSGDIYVANNGSNNVTKIKQKPSSQLGCNSAVTINASGTLDINNGYNTIVASQTLPTVNIGSLSGNGVLLTSASVNTVLTFGYDNTNTTFAGTLSNGSNGGSINLNKVGSGTFILAGSGNFGGLSQSGITCIDTVSSLFKISSNISVSGVHTGGNNNLQISVGATTSITKYGFDIGRWTAGTSTVDIYGTLSFTGTSTYGLYAGQPTAGCTGIINVQSGGTISMIGGAGSSGQFIIGNAQGTNSIGTLNMLSGSLVTLDSIDTGNGFVIGWTSGTGTLNLDGGILSTGRRIKTNGGTSIFNANGGTLKTTAALSTLLQGLTRLNVRDGGFVVDSNGFASTIAQPLLHSNIFSSSSMFATTGTQPYGSAFDTSGNLYISNYGSSNITKVTPAGVSSIFATVGSNPEGMVFDTLGNLYVACYGSNNIYKITPAGSSTLFATVGTNPSSIAIDLSGNLYTSNSGSNNVSKVTSAGVSTIFATVGTQPRGICIDSSGNLYTANFNSNNITKITPAGSPSTFAAVGSQPYGMVFDSFGNLFVTSYGAANVYKVTPAGSPSIFGTTGTNPIGIVIDLSGNLFVTNVTSNTVTKITSAGVSSTYASIGSNPRFPIIDSSSNLYIPIFDQNTVIKLIPVNDNAIDGGFTKIGSGTLSITGANTYTGPTNVNTGTLAVSGTMIASNAVNVASGATLSAAANNTWTMSPTGTWTIAGTMIGAANAQTTPPSIILNNGTMSGVSFSFGAFLLTNTTITCNGTSNLINAGNIGLGTGSANTISTPLITDTVVISAALGASSALSGTISKTGAGIVTFSGANIYTGVTNVISGQIINTSINTYASSNTIISSGATFTVDATSSKLSNTAGTFSGTGKLQKTGSAMWQVSNAGTNISMGAGGLIDIQGGILTDSNHTTSFVSNLASLNIASGASAYIGGNNWIVDALTGSGLVDYTINDGGPHSITVGVANTVAGSYNSLGVATFSGVIQDTSPQSLLVIKEGTGTQMFSGVNLHTGSTTVNNGFIGGTGTATSSSHIINLLYKSSTFASTGTGPREIVLDSLGNFYVCNYGTDNVTKITPGGIASLFATVGDQPQGICIDSLDNIYVSNFLSNDVTKITPGGSTSTISTPGTGPYRMVVDSSDNVYISNWSSGNITKITSGGVASIFATVGTYPVGICIDDTTGDLYVACYGSNNIYKVTSAGSSSIFSTTSSGPYGITRTPSGDIYTANYGSNNVGKIPNGGSYAIFGTAGTNPISIVVDSFGYVFVPNFGSANMTRLTPSGVPTIIASLGSSPVGIAVDSSYNIYVANQASNSITKIQTTVGGIFGGSGNGNAGTYSTGALTMAAGTQAQPTGAKLFVNIGSTTTVSKIAVTGDLIFNSNAVTFEPTALDANTSPGYLLFTYTGTQSGTLGVPVLTGTGRTFVGYTYTGGNVYVQLS